MTVAELITELQKIPGWVDVEVNNNRGGEIHSIHSVNYFSPEMDTEAHIAIAVIQVNV
jgi:hypothetical protein